MSGETIGGGTSDDMEELDAACNNPTRSCHSHTETTSSPQLSVRFIRAEPTNGQDP